MDFDRECGANWSDGPFWRTNWTYGPNWRSWRYGSYGLDRAYGMDRACGYRPYGTNWADRCSLYGYGPNWLDRACWGYRTNRMDGTNWRYGRSFDSHRTDRLDRPDRCNWGSFYGNGAYRIYRPNWIYRSDGVDGAYRIYRTCRIGHSV